MAKRILDKVSKSDLPTRIRESTSIKTREKTFLQSLNKLPKDRSVLVGGAALSAYFPRSTMDADVVLSEDDLDLVIQGLEGMDYREAEEFAREHELPYKGEFRAFGQEVLGDLVHVDLMVNMLKCRQTGAGYSYQYLREHSQERTVRGARSDEVVKNVRVPRPRT